MAQPWFTIALNHHNFARVQHCTLTPLHSCDVCIEGKHRSAEYEKFMRELTLFTVSGKNLHDDAPDACAMLVDFIAGGIKTVTVAKRPF